MSRQLSERRTTVILLVFWRSARRYRKEEETKRKDEDDRREPLATAILPYRRGLSEEVRRILGKYNVRKASEQPVCWEAFLIAKVKDPTSPNDRAGVINKLGCEYGDFYIGETGRSLNIRIQGSLQASGI